MLALRLTAYQGVMAARAEEQRERRPQAAPGMHPGEVAVELSDDVMLAKLANEGWSEHLEE